MGKSETLNKTSTDHKKKEVLELLEEEICQLAQEGKNIDGEIKRKFEQLRKEGSLDEMEAFYDRVENLDKRADYPYDEPSQIDEIKKKRPKKEITFPKIPDKDVLYDRIYGAWLGRCIGCPGKRFGEKNI